MKHALCLEDTAGCVMLLRRKNTKPPVKGKVIIGDHL